MSTQNDIIDAARRQCELYIKWAPDEWSKKEALEIYNTREGTHPLLLLRFSKRVGFGTAGLRAAMGAGISCLNPLIILQTCQGLYQYAKTEIDAFHERGVIIGFDGRRHSMEFAELTAKFFLHQGVRVYFMQNVIPTPFVPFGVVVLNTAIGIMITASHNPKQDNGFKLYWHNGAQIISPIDSNISALILDNLKPWFDSSTVAFDSSKVHDPTDRLWNQYFSTISAKPYCFGATSRDCPQLNVTYTAMHGVGLKAASAAFKSMNLQSFYQVAEQAHPDPEFPTVAFPNPEEGAGALELSFKTAKATKSTLILANDPDADRLAVAELQEDGKWRIFTGNEIAMLFADWIWMNYLKDNPQCDRSRAFMVASCVSSKFLAAMASSEGFQFFDTLTGFKWIGNKIIDQEKAGNCFLFAFEVEIGFLAGNMSYDKDGVRMAAMFAELANFHHYQSVTCSQRIEFLSEKYGYFCMKPSYFFCDRREQIDNVFKRLRSSAEFGRMGSKVFPIRSVRDVTMGIDSGEPNGKSKLPVTPLDQMITYRMENGTMITLRNSGTEPKLKYYIECKGKSQAESEFMLKLMTQIVIEDLIQPGKFGLKAPDNI